MSSIYDVLQSRGFISDCTDTEGFRELTAKRTISVYCGFDPTADSLHIGNMVALMGLMHFQREGHRPIALMGGATGMIGDPSGKSAERNLQTTEQIDANLAGQRPQFEKFLQFEGERGALIVNNFDWLGKISFIEFLRDTGKSFRLGEMLGKESVRARLQSEVGISYTEFSYMLLQAYDFKHLFEEEECLVQCGGADQWGNITVGIELIRKTLGKSAYGITFPLITTATGKKLGKTEKGAVWLDLKRTTSYDFYQYWMQREDSDVERFLKLFTLLPLADIEAIVAQHEKAPEKREGQKQLAWEVTRFIHGDEEASKARDASEKLFGGQDAGDMSDEELRRIYADVPAVTVDMAQENGAGLLDVVVDGGLASSKKEAKKLLQQGGLYLNDITVPADKRSLTAEDFGDQKLLLLRAGKKRYCLIAAK